jgi:hypothetical protein
MSVEALVCDEHVRQQRVHMLFTEDIMPIMHLTGIIFPTHISTNIIISANPKTIHSICLALFKNIHMILQLWFCFIFIPMTYLLR